MKFPHEIVNLFTLILKYLCRFVSKVISFNQGTGVFDYGTNKGGVLVAFRFMDQNLAFINCHLAARACRKRLVHRNE